VSTQRGDPEINEHIARCDEALARTMEGIVRRENLLYHLRHSDPLSAVNQDRITKHLEREGLRDANQV
jgi:hypothetical protein